MRAAKIKRRASRAQVLRSLRDLELLFRPPPENETATSGQAGSGGGFQGHYDSNIIAADYPRRKVRQ